MEYRIFAVNPGSTSTKIAMFKGNECLFTNSIQHDPEELKQFPDAISQLEYRISAIDNIINGLSADLNSVDAFAGRGGLLKPLIGGTYVVGADMLDDLLNSKYGNHACNLGAIIVDRFAVRSDKKAYVVNPPVVDEMMDIARYTGFPGIRRKSIFHALNQKAVAHRAADEAGIKYENGRFIVAHLGGGISVGAHDRGMVIDVNNGLEEGPFSPERAGSLPSWQLVDLCFSGRYTNGEIGKLLVGGGGLNAYTGVTDCRKLETKAHYDINIKKLLDAMIYKIAREICACSAALYGNVDRIVITGGLAKSPYIVNGIIERVSFLGPVTVVPGEDELAALAEGVSRVLQGREQVLEYRKEGSSG